MGESRVVGIASDQRRAVPPVIGTCGDRLEGSITDRRAAGLINSRSRSAGRGPA